MASVSNIYFDRVSQIRLDRWTKGRTALVGDAAACVSLLAGEGSGLAMAEAYVLAGELRNCGGDYGAAFARYQERLMPFLKRKQKSAAKFASSFAPKTAFGITFRNLVTRLMAAAVRCGFLHRPRNAGSGQAPRLWVLTDLPAERGRRGHAELQSRISGSRGSATRLLLASVQSTAAPQPSSPARSGPTRRCRFPGWSGSADASSAVHLRKAAIEAGVRVYPRTESARCRIAPAPGRSILARMPSLPRLILSCRRLPASSGCFGPFADLHNPRCDASQRFMPLLDSSCLDRPPCARVSSYPVFERPPAAVPGPPTPPPPRTGRGLPLRRPVPRRGRLNRRPTSVNQHRPRQVDGSLDLLL